MKNKNIVCEKSFEFAKEIIVVTKDLITFKKEYILSKQLLRSGTSIGANITEAQRGQSRRDFLSKMNIALKEANETEYWLMLLTDTDIIDRKKGENLQIKCKELCKLLNAIVNTTGGKKLY